VKNRLEIKNRLETVTLAEKNRLEIKKNRLEIVTLAVKNRLEILTLAVKKMQKTKID
jgi:hypothetical protein